MMASRGSYPHPVLDVSDDVASNFEVVNAHVGPTHDDVEISLEIRTDDPDLSRLIEDGLARHSLRWTCSATISTGEAEVEVFKRTSDGLAIRTWLDQQQLRGDVDLEIRTIACKPIPDFQWQRQHADYGAARFNIATGDILADGGTIRFHTNKLYDPLAPPIGSCFSFMSDPNLRKGMQVGFDNKDKVVVRLPPDVLQGLSALAARPDLQIAMVVLPALMETLVKIKENEAGGDDVLEEMSWYQPINDMAEASGGLELSPLTLAQTILENPTDRALLTGIATGEDEE